MLLDKVQGLPPEKQLEALKVPSEEQAEAVELARALIKREPWAKVSKILRTIKAEPEEVRWVVLGYARAVLLGRGDEQTFMVLQAFENNFYDSKAAGLARACYEALHCK